MPSTLEPVRYIGGQTANIDYHHGQLRPAIGVQTFQVLRANRSRPELAEAYGWTYNHAPMLAYWNGKFYLEYLSNPIGEHLPLFHLVAYLHNGFLVLAGAFVHAHKFPEQIEV